MSAGLRNAMRGQSREAFPEFGARVTYDGKKAAARSASGCTFRQHD
jgi:hypothetical protein